MTASATESHAVPFRVTDPQKIPAPRYYDPAFFALETEKLWSRTWQMACRLETIPNLGDWIEYSILGRSVIVTRTKSGVRAFHNACRHRGVQLVPTGSHGNCKTQGFICPFHGWRWNGEGKNTFVYGRHLFDESLLGEDELRLPECRVEEALGCVFINFDDDALSLRETWGPVLDRLHQLGQRPASQRRGRGPARRMVVRHRDSGQLEARDGSLHARLPRDAHPSAAAARGADPLQLDVWP